MDARCFQLHQPDRNRRRTERVCRQTGPGKSDARRHFPDAAGTRIASDSHASRASRRRAARYGGWTRLLGPFHTRRRVAHLSRHAADLRVDWIGPDGAVHRNDTPRKRKSQQRQGPRAERS